MPITYTPQFSHTDWIDNVDRVQAGGDTGLNIRFHGIEGEFASLSTVVKAISDAIDALSAAPPPSILTASLTPALLPTTTVVADQWQQTDSAAVMPPGQTTAHGMMGIQLPNGATITSLRILGAKGSGTLLVGLNRQGFTSGASVEVVVANQIGAGNNGPFDVTANATDATKTKVDNSSYRYYVVVRLDGGNAAAINGSEVDAIVVAYSK